MKDLITTLFAISVLAILVGCSTKEQQFVTGRNLNEELHLETLVNYDVNYLFRKIQQEGVW